MSQKLDELTVVLLGDGGVGKSALVIRWAIDKFLEDYEPTIEDTYQRDVKVDDEFVHLEILDTAGQEEYSSLESTWYQQGDAFMLLFAITSLNAFDRVKYHHTKLLRAHEDKDQLPILLVGTKCDLEDERQVERSAAEELATEMDSVYIETSALTSTNIQSAFDEIVRQWRKVREATGGRTSSGGGGGGGLLKKCMIL
ncbi:MAG: hypothetical protein MHM6MM_001422 [Cercozoa sp. M6MM]